MGIKNTIPEDKNHHGHEEDNKVESQIRNVVADEDVTGVFDNACHRVQENIPVILDRDDGNRINDGRKPKTDLKKDLPDVLEIAKMKVQRREQKRHSGGDHVEFNDVDDEKKRRCLDGYTRNEHEDEKNDEIQQQCDQARKRARKNDDGAREINLGDEISLGDKAVHADERGLGKKVPQNDPKEQIDRIVFDRRLHEDREHEVDHAKEQQRFDKRPEIAQKRVLIAEFKFAFDELDENAQMLLLELFVEIFGPHAR